VGHEIHRRSHHGMIAIRLGWLVDRMHGRLGRRHLEQQPAAADVDRLQPDDVAQKRAILFGISAVEQDVGAVDHHCLLKRPVYTALPRMWPAIAATTAARVCGGDWPTAGTSIVASRA